MLKLPSGALICADESKIALIKPHHYHDGRAVDITYLNGAYIELTTDADIDAFMTAIEAQEQAAPAKIEAQPLRELKFKLSDRVRVNEPERTHHNEVGTIVRIDPSEFTAYPYEIAFTHAIDDASDWIETAWYSEDDLNPVTSEKTVLIEQSDGTIGEWTLKN